jgi:5-methylcytosine-specific restriction endonuclease McrA
VVESYYARNKERLKAKANARYKEKRLEIRVKQNEYARAHRAEAQARQQAWRVANPEKYREQARRLYAASPKRRAGIKMATARRRSAGAKCNCCSTKQIRIVYEAAELIGGEVDHILAFSLGGKHCVKNLQILDVEQHKEKTKRDLAEARRRHATAK